MSSVVEDDEGGIIEVLPAVGVQIAAGGRGVAAAVLAWLVQQRFRSGVGALPRVLMVVVVVAVSIVDWYPIAPDSAVASAGVCRSDQLRRVPAAQFVCE